MRIETIVCGALEENAYIVSRSGRDDCAVIDPGDDAQALLRALAGRRVAGILLTHGHYDHILGAKALQDVSGAEIYAGAADLPMLQEAALCLYDPGACRAPFEPMEGRAYGEEISLAGICLRVCPTPGHTPGSVCLYDQAEQVIFTGDTLFLGGYGRVDLPGGSFRQLRESLRFLLSLPGEIRFYPGHGPGGRIGENR